MNKKLLFSALVAGATLTSAGLNAQVSKNSGFLLNAHLQGSGLTIEDEDTETGFGAGITAGYGFNENVALFLTLDGAKINVSEDEGVEDDVALAHLDLGLRYTFGNTSSALRPYVLGALSGVGVAFESPLGDVTYSGPAGTFGAGLQYYINPKLAIDGGIQASIGKLTSIELDGEEFDDEDEGENPSITTSRLQIGLTWHP